jgi:hypothetical protein
VLDFTEAASVLSFTSEGLVGFVLPLSAYVELLGLSSALLLLPEILERIPLNDRVDSLVSDLLKEG